MYVSNKPSPAVNVVVMANWQQPAVPPGGVFGQQAYAAE